MSKDGLQERIELLTKNGYRKDEFGYYVKKMSEGDCHVMSQIHLTEISAYPDLDTLNSAIKYREEEMKEKLRKTVYHYNKNKGGSVPSLRELIGIDTFNTYFFLQSVGMDLSTLYMADFIAGDLSEVSGKPYYVALKHREGKTLEIFTKEDVSFYQDRVDNSIILGPEEMKNHLEKLGIVK
ncbi:hypothetical protein Goe19_01700 [Bacillus phage vB_BsuM-Goe19]|nr:hypothetical protein Goe19_01700 [Bacillus phage vB_BsuM-Goe19]